jgi:hypothetical protein
MTAKRATANQARLLIKSSKITQAQTVRPIITASIAMPMSRHQEQPIGGIGMDGSKKVHIP